MRKVYPRLICFIITLIMIHYGSCAAKDSSEVLLVFSGLTGTHFKMRKVVKTLDKVLPYPVINVRFKSRCSLNKCEENIVSQFKQLNILKYKRVHFFCFIMGGYVLSKVLQKNPLQNIGTIVIDRSPYQEPLSIETKKVFSRTFVKLLFGQTIIDLGDLKYHDIQASNLGILIETKPGLLVRMINRIERSGKKQGRMLHFEADSIMACYDDVLYVNMSHSEMYNNIADYAHQIVSFFNNGYFEEKQTMLSMPDDTLYYGILPGRN